MVGASLTGLALVGVAAVGMMRSPLRDMKKLLHEVFELAKIEVKQGGGYDEPVVHRPEIIRLKKTKYGFDSIIRLPKGYAVEQFKEKLPIIEQTTASKIKFRYLKGRDVQLQLGTLPLHLKMGWTENLVQPGRLAVPYYTPFGVQYIDFEDETCCHIIVAGTTRMGKSVFLRLMFTQLILASDGNVQFVYINNKPSDYYPMQGIPQIPEPAETLRDAYQALLEVKAECDRRKAILKATRDSVNIKQYRLKHGADGIPPLFVVFDEFGRFVPDNKKDELGEKVQDLVQEISETAGYLDIHLVIATQRPDATSVLRPRIRANVLTRVCFQTADEKNSEIVVHTKDAAHLDEIQGRAIVLDGMPNLAQIPYISEDLTAELLRPYRRDDDADRQRQKNPEVPTTLPSFVKGSVGSDHLPGNIETVGDNQSNHEETRPGRPHHHDSEAEGRVLPLHAEPGDHPNGVDEDTPFPFDSRFLHSDRSTRDLRGRTPRKR